MYSYYKKNKINDYHKNILLSLCFSLFFVLFAKAQETSVLKGKVIDETGVEYLIGATVLVTELEKGVATDINGNYSIEIPNGNYTLRASYIGYQDTYNKVSINGNQTLNIRLKKESSELSEVVIIQNKTKADIRTPEMSVNKLSAEEVKKMPVVLGETDILKSILQLPGVTNAGEGAAGFNVRGGSAGQNLVLLDDAVLYSSSHLFGFFSIFNTDAIKDLKLYKGGIPARFGGRGSSVLEVFQKEGNRNNYNFEGGIGLISSRLLVEGPVQKGKSSFLVAGRGSYAHLFLKLSDNENSAYFYDINAKFSYDINEKNKLNFSAYYGNDVFSFANLMNNTFGNIAIGGNWKTLFNDDLTGTFAVNYSKYIYNLDLDLVGFNWKSGIGSLQLKYDFLQDINPKLQLRYGINYNRYSFYPGTIKPTSTDSQIVYQKFDTKYAQDTNIYIEAEQTIGQNFSINYGLRSSNFRAMGKGKEYLYANNQPVIFDSNLGVYKMADKIGEATYGNNKTIKSFHYLEPRLGFAYILNDEKSIKLSYNRMVQYIHLMSNTSAPTPLDIWTPSGTYVDPAIVDQVAIGYFQNFKNARYSLETEVFYKNTKNSIDYIDGAQLIGNEAIERVILDGKARAYGWELLVRKNLGKLTGWVSYTLSKTEQKTPGRTPEEPGINNGNWYRASYDKLHDLSVTALYELNEKWTFGASFTLQSGRPITYPDGQYEYLGHRIPKFGARNAHSMPAYHHLDVSAIYTPNPNSTKRWQGEWVFGIYNLYSRYNAASISFKENKDIRGKNEAEKLSIFGFVPSVTYNFKF